MSLTEKSDDGSPGRMTEELAGERGVPARGLGFTPELLLPPRVESTEPGKHGLVEGWVSSGRKGEKMDFIRRSCAGHPKMDSVSALKFLP